MTTPGRRHLTALFLPLAIALQLLVWRLWIYPAALPPAWAQLAHMLAPVLAAAIVGIWWRRRLATSPDWAERRPYSRLMAVLLFLYGVFLNWFAMFVTLSLTQKNPPDISTLWLWAGLPRRLLAPDVVGPWIFSLVLRFLLCLIQTEIGLFLGVFAADRIRRQRS